MQVGCDVPCIPLFQLHTHTDIGLLYEQSNGRDVFSCGTNWHEVNILGMLTLSDKHMLARFREREE